MGTSKVKKASIRLAPQVLQATRRLVVEECQKVAGACFQSDAKNRQLLEQMLSGQITTLRASLTRRHWWEFWKLPKR